MAATIEFVVSDSAIESVNVLESSETLGIGQLALERLTAEVVEYQSIGLDSVSGATITSNAFFAIAEDALTQAGADLAALKKPVEKAVSSEVKKLEADVVVVGAGLSGLCAAVSAAENGAKVIVLEKLAVTGGSAKASLGSYMVCEVPENEGHHVSDEPDTLDAAMERWLNYQKNSTRESIYPDVERVREQLIQSMFTISWLKSFGASFAPKSPIAERGMAMAQVDVASDKTDGKPAAKVLNLLKQVALDHGAEIYTETPATELIQENGAVVGVKATSPTGPVEVRAKNVILATGGFPNNQEMIAEMIPELTEVFSIASVGNTGDGIRMAEAVGAVTYEDNWMIGLGLRSPVQQMNNFYWYGTFAFVNNDGERFTNEGGHYAIVYNDAVFSAPGGAWMLFDSGEAFKPFVEAAEGAAESEHVLKADTLEELAAAIGADAAKLSATIASYNQVAAGGTDPFGKPAMQCVPLTAGPFYAVRFYPCNMGTFGGVKTTDSFEVIDASGSPIPGLYAAGEMCNRPFYNMVYMSGSALQLAALTGQTAGEAAAAYAKK